MRILTFSNTPLDPMLGSGKVRIRLRDGLRARGHEVTVLDSDGFSIRWKKVLGRNLNMAVGATQMLQRLPWRSFDLIEFCGGEFWRATEWLSRQPGLRPMIVARTDGLELLASERLSQSSATGDAASPLRRLLRKIPMFDYATRARGAFRHADRFASLCRLDQEWVIRHGYFRPGHTAVAPPGLDDAFLNAPGAAQKDRQLAFFGSWVARKGIVTLAEVSSRILKSDPDCELVLMGCGETPSATILGAFPETVRSRIRIIPRSPTGTIATLLARARVFFFPTEYEGFGMATAEAMACGCAVVTTPTGFGGELVDGTEAMICPFGDADAMEAAIRRLLADTPFSRRLESAGRQRVRMLRWETQVSTLETHYGKWLHEWAEADKRHAAGP